jgi:hypothetical protein
MIALNASCMSTHTINKMRRKFMRKPYLLLFLLLFFPVLSGAQDLEKYYQKGDMEVGFNGGYHRVDISGNGESDHAGIVTVSADGSYFINDEISFGLGTVFTYLPDTSIENGNSFSGFLGGLEASAKYHFQINKKFIPYLGVNLAYGLAWGESNRDSSSENFWTYGFSTGFKVPINKNIYFDTQLKFTEYEADFLDDIDLSTTQVLLGLKIKL